jgi:hypothetical protein
MDADTTLLQDEGEYVNAFGLRVDRVIRRLITRCDVVACHHCIARSTLMTTTTEGHIPGAKHSRLPSGHHSRYHRYQCLARCLATKCHFHGFAGSAWHSKKRDTQESQHYLQNVVFVLMRSRRLW